MSATTKWIDLNDPVGVRLRVASLENRLLYVITGIKPGTRLFTRVIEELKFRSSPTGAYLIRPFQDGEQARPSEFRSIWPGAATRVMTRSEFFIDLDAARRSRANREEAASQQREQEADELARLVASGLFLGRNADGARIFEDITGRSLVTDGGAMMREGAGMAPTSFLRASTERDLIACAQGFLREVSLGEIQREADFHRFVRATFPDVPADVASMRMAWSAIEAAFVEHLMREHDSAAAAWGDAVHIYESMPGGSITREVGAAPVPMPVALAAQRLLGVGAAQEGASEPSVLIPSAGNGAAFACYPEGVKILAVRSESGSALAEANIHWNLGVTWADSVDPQARHDGILAHNVDWQAGARGEGVASPAVLAAGLLPGARAVLTLDAGEMQSDTGRLAPEMRQYLASLEAVGTIEYAFDVSRALTQAGGAPNGTRVLVFRNRPRRAEDQSYAEADKLPVCFDWDGVKTIVDETLTLRENATEIEVDPDEPIKVGDLREENRYQRPYAAFSRTGSGSTMVPKNLQASLSYALAKLEEERGQIDEFVAHELGMGYETLPERFSPEQIDAISLMINRVQQGRGAILGDETGIGKGRSLSALAAWANKQGRPVIFFTDRANLFSDLARDLIDIEEWGRFRPFITNQDGQILDIAGEGQVLAEPVPAARMKAVLAENLSPEQIGANIIFTTYSQVNSKDSPKGDWLLNHCQDALVFFDEAHVAAGSDSNTAERVHQIAESAWGVVYSSATWAKAAKNLHIYSRAFPESVNIQQVTDAMNRGGEEFGEVFSAMLARDGGFIRREHDLSKIDFVVEVDSLRTDRNTAVAGQVSEILGMMAMVSGEIDHLLQRANSHTKSLLLAAQAAREQIRKAEAAEEKREIEAIDAIELQIARWDATASSTLSQRTAAQAELASLIAVRGPADPPSQEELAVSERIDQSVTALETAEATLTGLRAELAQAKAAARANARTRVGRARQSATQAAGRLFASRFGTGGAIYQAMRRTLAALSTDHAIERALKAIEAGRRPVIVFEDTGEAMVRQLIEEETLRMQRAAQNATQDDTGHDAELVNQATQMLDERIRAQSQVDAIRMPTLRDLMKALVSRLGAIRAVDVSADGEDGRADDDADRLGGLAIADVPGVTAEQVAAYRTGIEQIIERIAALPEMPIMPADVIRVGLEQAGQRVGEISGRGLQLTPIDASRPAGLAKISKRARKKTDIMRTVRDFNWGNLDVLTINRAAATGLSLHASPRFGNTQQRELIEFQIPENPTERIQLFGRVNRFDQVVAPQITILTTGLYGEMRTLMMQNRKLAGLSANIRSSRDNAALIEEVPDLLNRLGDEVCRDYLLENPGVAGRMSIELRSAQDAAGLANKVTQRIALLAPRDQKKVYDDLYMAYDDAVIQNEIAGESSGIKDNDWRARTEREVLAWGTDQNLELLSAFDGPVYLRDVAYEKDYQPLQWEQLEARIADQIERLKDSDRTGRVPVRGVVRSMTAPMLRTLDREASAAAPERAEQFARAIFEEIIDAIPADAIPGTEEEASGKLKGLAAIGGKMLTFGARVPGSEMELRLMALMSRSGETATIWHSNPEAAQMEGKPAGMQWRINVKAAVLSDGEACAGALRKLNTWNAEDMPSDAWWVERFRREWGTDPKFEALTFMPAARKAAEVLEAKKLIGLAQTNFGTIEEALADGEHNAVKESHQRKLFAETVLPHLTPGTQIWVREEEGSKFAHFFADRRMVIVGVDMPPPNEESMLSKWRFHLASPGEEKPVILSASHLLRRAGAAPEFPRIHIDGSLFSRSKRFELKDAARRFNDFEPGPVRMTRSLLVGNLFQAAEWAAATKKGTAITYTDETGQRHRAISIHKRGWGGESEFSVLSMPLRLHQKGMIVNFIEAAVSGRGDPDHVDSGRVYAHVSFKSALSTGQVGAKNENWFNIDLNNNRIEMDLDKSEKAKFVKTMRQAIERDQKAWAVTHPDQPYPINLALSATKTGKSESRTVMYIGLPETWEGRERLINAMVKSQGLQLYVSRRNRGSYRTARLAEQRYYEQLIGPLADERAARVAEQEERRAQVRQLLATSAQAEAPAQEIEVHQVAAGAVIDVVGEPDRSDAIGDALEEQSRITASSRELG
ncbi:strawberry notch family protein (plasmid) [Cupriavidus pinatubonensis]|uniref:strawberry notch C-terminal domain-containing protein n=1 Tax=Cupriavidus pinatubonensis TaxID=248026 RepID=UPI001C72BA0D|nr:strawberry notch C-terminal domain-containing protein [Cupriavidus pinatubonensis]QYY33723.1 strawberry notch family protein [Cupriavidus pinatubonensis]